MKGLLLAKEYYHHLGAPMFRDRFTEIVDHIAVGFVGPGSECFGFDKDIACTAGSVMIIFAAGLLLPDNP